MRQELLYMPQAERRGSVPFTGKAPKYIWTLFEAHDESKKPELPITPQHMHNAFMEDRYHDWIVQGGLLYYYSRVTDLKRMGVWLLLEWDE